MTKKRRRILDKINRQRMTVLVLFVSILFCGAIAMAQVWTRIKVIDYGYKLSKARKLRHKLSEENHQLRMELALLKSPARITEFAREKLGLVSLEPNKIKRLNTKRLKVAALPPKPSNEVRIH